MKKKKAFAIGLLVFTALICDGLIGVLIKVRGMDAAIPEVTPWRLVAYQPHPFRAYMLKPGLEFDRVGVKTVANEYGHLVLPEDVDLHKRARPENQYRILLVGGSTTFQGWCFRLTELLNRDSATSGRTFKPICAGTGAYTSMENIIDLITTGFSYEPDLVMAYLPVNDLYRVPELPEFKRDYTQLRIPMRGRPPPEFLRKDWRYPFTLRMLKIIWWKKIRNLDTYIRVPDRDDWREEALQNADELNALTTDVVIDNIFNMKTLCEAREIPFVLISQKLYDVDDRELEQMRMARTMEAIAAIKASERLDSMHILEMGNVFPDRISPEDEARIRDAFPDFDVDFDVPIARDSMHPNFPGLLLFAMHVEDYLRNAEFFPGNRVGKSE